MKLVGSSLVTPLTPPMYYTDTTGVTRILRPADLRPDPARGLPGLTSRDLPRGHMFDGVEYPCAARLELEEAEEKKRSKEEMKKRRQDFAFRVGDELARARRELLVDDMGF